MYIFLKDSPPTCHSRLKMEGEVVNFRIIPTPASTFLIFHNFHSMIFRIEWGLHSFSSSSEDRSSSVSNWTQILFPRLIVELSVSKWFCLGPIRRLHVAVPASPFPIRLNGVVPGSGFKMDSSFCGRRGVKWVHWDLADRHFPRNYAIPPIIQQLKNFQPHHSQTNRRTEGDFINNWEWKTRERFWN